MRAIERLIPGFRRGATDASWGREEDPSPFSGGTGSGDLRGRMGETYPDGSQSLGEVYPDGSQSLGYIDIRTDPGLWGLADDLQDDFTGGTIDEAGNVVDDTGTPIGTATPEDRATVAVASMDPNTKAALQQVNPNVFSAGNAGQLLQQITAAMNQANLTSIQRQALGNQLASIQGGLFSQRNVPMLIIGAVAIAFLMRGSRR